MPTLLGVELKSNDAPQTVLEEPLMTLLQRANNYDAFYRIDRLEKTGPELLVLLPNNIYRMHMSKPALLTGVLTLLSKYQGSEDSEQKQELSE